MGKSYAPLHNNTKFFEFSPTLKGISQAMLQPTNMFDNMVELQLGRINVFKLMLQFDIVREINFYVKICGIFLVSQKSYKTLQRYDKLLREVVIENPIDFFQHLGCDVKGYLVERLPG